MAKQAISVTLEADNLTWLKGRAGAAGVRSVSELLDQLVTAARESGGAGHATSVVGTIDIDPGDPMLERRRRSGPRAVRRVAGPAADGQGSGASSTEPPAAEESAVAEPEAAVTDTHALVFHAAGGGKLGPRAAAFFDRCERREAILYVPTVVMWECSLLARVSRINLRRTVRAFFDDLFSNPAYQPLDVTPRADLSAPTNCASHRDPFDALICAAAQTIDLPLITRDAEIRASGAVKVIW